ncbi:MAG: lipoyl(octanoyl) transferase LipB [bacterium]|nr:lipoyl(octanoyl) transferase LipB [bacterium]
MEEACEQMCSNQSDKKPSLAIIDLGLVTFEEGRRRQQQLIEDCRSGRGDEGLLFCEHFSIVTSGTRSRREGVGLAGKLLENAGIEMVEVDRGGRLTWHGPGQIVVYPVISLKKRGFGVRDFVTAGLDAFKNVVKKFGVEADSNLEDAGVWIVSSFGERLKIASVGLKIEQGYSNHGFSFNCDCDLSVYKLFSPCGFSGEVITSLSAELRKLGKGVPDKVELKRLVASELMRSLS